ncbi:MAG: hypothetical protein RLN62_05400 [Rickettsiales bacterium]
MPTKKRTHSPTKKLRIVFPNREHEEGSGETTSGPTDVIHEIDLLLADTFPTHPADEFGMPFDGDLPTTFGMNLGFLLPGDSAGFNILFDLGSK